MLNTVCTLLAFSGYTVTLLLIGADFCFWRLPNVSTCYVAVFRCQSKASHKQSLYESQPITLTYMANVYASAMQETWQRCQNSE
jgi:hypothetical protein